MVVLLIWRYSWMSKMVVMKVHVPLKAARFGNELNTGLEEEPKGGP